MPIAAHLLRSTLGYFSRRRLPVLDGRLTIHGLHSHVTIRRDAHGIPHIHAVNRADLYFAQGFVHAQDRLWQMELNRRSAHGTLAAILGPAALDIDRTARTLDFASIARATWPLVDQSIRDDATAYAAGVNAFLDTRAPLPMEFSLLRHRPEAWQPLDSFAYGRLLLWSLSYGWAGELVRANLHQTLGERLAAELEPQYPAGHPLTLPVGIVFNGLTAEGLRPLTGGPFLGKGRLDGGGRGSNGWVVSGQRTASGRPILANDMHLPLTAPSLWYLCQLQDGTHHVAGASQPGLPYVLVGHNEHIAWGATLAFTDVEDLYVERLVPSRPDHYHFGDRQRPLRRRVETIEVRGQDAHVETIVATHHGPLISPLVAPDGPPLALSAVPLRADQSFDGFARLNRARDWDDFVGAVAQMAAPPLNLLYADVAGNIGHYVTGRVPIRQLGDGRTPAPGYSAKHEWSGYIPFEEMPHALNPERGYIVTANNRLVDDRYPHFLGEHWTNGYRARRIVELLSEAPPLTVAACALIQTDLLCRPGLELVAALEDVTAVEPDAALALRLLREWDGRLDTDAIGGTVYAFFQRALTDVILAPQLGALLPDFLGQGPLPILYPINEFYGHWTPTMLRILADERSAWLGAAIGREALLLRCLALTTDRLRQRLGADPYQWRWGRVQQLTFGHALARQRPLDGVFNRGPYPLGGNTDTVCQVATSPDGPSDDISFSVSYRQIIDVGGWDNSRVIIAPGQSGQIGSPHYDDLVSFWLAGDALPLPWSETALDAATRHTLRLTPP